MPFKTVVRDIIGLSRMRGCFSSTNTRHSLASACPRPTYGGSGWRVFGAKMASGIYEIRNTINNHRYIGSTATLKKRWNCHRHLLRKGKHTNAHLQNAWNKYGEDAFSFQLLFRCDEEMLILFEQRTIDALKPKYNIRPIANSNLGIKHTPEACANMSAAAKKRGFSDEHRANLSAALMGNQNGRGMKGFRHTANARAKMSKAAKGNQNAKGYKHTQEARLKMSISKRERNEQLAKEN